MARAMAMAASTIACASSAPPPPSFSSASSTSSALGPSPVPRQARFPSSNPTRLPSLSATPSPHDPSLQFANIMWFKGPYNTQIFVGESEPAESVVKRFKRAVMQAGIISECRRRRFFETPQEVVKRKRQAAQRRRSKSRFFPKGMNDQKKPTKAVPRGDDDEDDNWEYEGMGA